MGYCFLAKEGSGVPVTVLTLKGRASRAILARPVLRKGQVREGAVGQAVSSIYRLGHHGEVLLKMDNEPALIDLNAGVAEKLGLQEAAEAPPAHEPQSLAQWRIRSSS
eukprot:10210607-Alexandrium_andersonii.AAC.1